jgi:thioredoxin-like negative regulator of GroEL
VAARYEVEAIPTIMLFWKGEPVMRLQGARPYADLRAALEAHWPKGLHGDSGAEQQRQGPYGNSRAEGPQQRQGPYGNSRAEGPQQRQGQ